MTDDTMLEDAQRRIEERREGGAGLQPIRETTRAILDEIKARAGTHEPCEAPGCSFWRPIGQPCPGCRQRREQLAVDQRAAFGRIPPRYQPALEIPLRPEVAEWAGEPWAVVFQGPNGTGKTWAATRLLRSAALRLETPSLAWVGGLQLAADLRRSVSEGGDPLLELCSLRLLLLDDVLAVRETEFVVDALRYVLSWRYDHCAPTILTMDRPVSDLEPRLGSRLAEGVLVACKGEDRRRR